MSKKSFVKLSEEELLDRLTRYEKRERNLKCYGLCGAIIGLIGLIICMASGSELALIFVAIVLVGGVCYYMGVRLRRKAESLWAASLTRNWKGPSAPTWILRKCASTRRF